MAMKSVHGSNRVVGDVALVTTVILFEGGTFQWHSLSERIIFLNFDPSHMRQVVCKKHSNEEA